MKLKFKTTISWNKYRPKITTQPKNNNLDYMTDATFTNIHRLSVQSFKAGENHPTRNTFNTYYMSLVEIKAFNVLTKNKPFFDKLLKKNKKCMKNLLKCQETITIRKLIRLCVPSETL